MKKILYKLLRDFYATKYNVYDGEFNDSHLDKAYRVEIVSYVPACLRYYFDNDKSKKYKL
jgi:hypothetical protein